LGDAQSSQIFSLMTRTLIFFDEQGKPVLMFISITTFQKKMNLFDPSEWMDEREDISPFAIDNLWDSVFPTF
jgi:hypothetical protein